MSQRTEAFHVLVATTRREEMLHYRRSAHASKVSSFHAQTTFEETVKKDFENLQVKRGYPVPIARKYLSELKFADRKTALQQSNKSACKNPLPFVTK